MTGAIRRHGIARNEGITAATDGRTTGEKGRTSKNANSVTTTESEATEPEATSRLEIVRTDPSARIAIRNLIKATAHRTAVGALAELHLTKPAANSLKSNTRSYPTPYLWRPHSKTRKSSPPLNTKFQSHGLYHRKISTPKSYRNNLNFLK